MTTPAPDLRKTMKLKHAAEIEGIGVDTLKAERARGRSKTYRIGREIRTTLADIREMVERMNALARPVGNLEANRFAFCPVGVYVVGFADYIKIGWSSDIQKRIWEIQQGVPCELKVYGLLEGDIAIERALHRRFRQYRLRGEWFKNDGLLAEWLRRECQE